MVATSNKKLRKIIRKKEPEVPRDHLGFVGDASSQYTTDNTAKQIPGRTEMEGTKTSGNHQVTGIKIIGSHKEVGTIITRTRMVDGKARQPESTTRPCGPMGGAKSRILGVPSES